MKRNIITIDEDKCNGCSLCVSACHEGALQMIGGKARLITDSYCDGLGACLPECPTGAITISERDAEAFDEVAVKAHLSTTAAVAGDLPCGCPGTQARTIERKISVPDGSRTSDLQTPAQTTSQTTSQIPTQTTSQTPTQTPTQTTSQIPVQSPTQTRMESQLRQWPVQIKLVPVKAPYLQNANLLVAADCTAFAYADIHNDYMKNRITLIGCPKLDEGDYSDKLTAILENNEIKSITVLRMEVPCCGGIANAVKTALVRSRRMIPWQVVTIGTNGDIL